MRPRLFFWIFCGLFAAGCGTSYDYTDHPVKLRIPFWLGEPTIPEDNQMTELRIDLGRKLFYDTRMSIDGKTSCASCHVASAAFTDGRAGTDGDGNKLPMRNAPTLANLAWMPDFMMEGGVPTLELQALAPLHDTTEMGLGVLAAAKVLKADERLNALSKAAYGRELDPFVISRALACFQRTFISADSHYDRFAYQGKLDELTDAQIRGMEIFFSGRAQCSSCHKPPFFTDFDYHNIGLYQHYQDSGRERITYDPMDSGKFKTPTLRNVSFTAPYMHDGSMLSLREVVEFYDSGGRGHSRQDERIHPLNLTEEEKVELIEFMEALNDWNFVQNKAFLSLE